MRAAGEVLELADGSRPGGDKLWPSSTIVASAFELDRLDPLALPPCLDQTVVRVRRLSVIAACEVR